jgi:hypothetical protein
VDLYAVCPADQRQCHPVDHPMLIIGPWSRRVSADLACLVDQGRSWQESPAPLDATAILQALRCVASHCAMCVRCELSLNLLVPLSQSLLLWLPAGNASDHVDGRGCGRPWVKGWVMGNARYPH